MKSMKIGSSKFKIKYKIKKSLRANSTNAPMLQLLAHNVLTNCSIETCSSTNGKNIGNEKT